MKPKPRHIDPPRHGRPAHDGPTCALRTENRKGFSLTEVLIAAGILVVGFLLICCTLPVGIHLTAKGTERAIGAVVAEEAFAKIRLHGIRPVEYWPADVAQGNVIVDPNVIVMHVDYWDVAGMPLVEDDFAYPSADIYPEIKKYHWSALLRYMRYNNADLGDDSFQVTVFVTRITGLGLQYPRIDREGLLRDAFNRPVTAPFPRPVLLSIEPYNPAAGLITDEIIISGGALNDPDRRFMAVTDESVLLDDRTGQIMRVIERRKLSPVILEPPVLVLDGKVYNSDLDGDGEVDPNRYAWVIPPAVGGGRYPGIAVYQRVIKLNDTP